MQKSNEGNSSSQCVIYKAVSHSCQNGSFLSKLYGNIYIWTSSFSFHYITAKFNFLGIKNNGTVCFGVIFIANFGRIKTLEYLISQDTKDLITLYERKSAIYQSILPTNYF